MVYFVFGRRVLQRWFPLSGWSDNGGSVFGSTWPLNRCWVAGLRRAAETCSGSVDLSVQTEPSIICVWQLWPWTPARSICSACACKNQPRSERSRLCFYHFRLPQKFTGFLSSVFSSFRKTYFFFVWNYWSIWNCSMQLYLIIRCQPNHDHIRTQFRCCPPGGTRSAGDGPRGVKTTLISLAAHIWLSPPHLRCFTLQFLQILTLIWCQI